MRVGNFSLTVPEGDERDDGHVRLAPGTPYAPRLGSTHAGPTDVELTVDGRPAGTYRLPPGGTLAVEGPAHDPARGRFTLYAADSADGRLAGADDVPADRRGLVVAVFRPGKPAPVQPDVRRKRDWRKYLHGLQRNTRAAAGVAKGVYRSVIMYADATRPGAGADAAPGVTGLSGRTAQRWEAAPPIEYLPPEEVVTITLRLVAAPRTQAPRPIPPVRPQANPVPEPVG